jgi:hypothetical protein
MNMDEVQKEITCNKIPASWAVTHQQATGGDSGMMSTIPWTNEL